ncbi:MAG: ribosome biogenesis GTPase YlqF [Clostridiales bacterium]|nr:ribosome biogenesis GTPase YlqF [Clostridiales bacterium]
MNIQWFPGHMTKARRMIEENMKLVDPVCKIIDARIPFSSRNPDIDKLAGSKPRLVILNRIDQADPSVTALWRDFFTSRGFAVLETDCKSGKGISGFPNAVRAVLKDKIEAYAVKGQATRPLRAMILGIPNVGKSTFINRAAGRKAALVSDKPGVTRGKQWITIDHGLELLDTPGILWPRFDNQQVGENLAVTGAIRDEILDRETLAANFMVKLRELYPQSIEHRYKFTPSPSANGFELLEEAAKKRGFIVSKGEYDLERMAATLLDEFRGGKLGRISLEKPDIFEKQA